MKHKLRVVFPNPTKQKEPKVKKPALRKNSKIVPSASFAEQWAKRISSSINVLSKQRERFITRSKKMDQKKRQQIIDEYSSKIRGLKKFYDKLDRQTPQNVLFKNLK